MPIPSVGKKIPSFTAKLTDDSEVKIADLMGKKGLIIYFYPKDMTPGCTTQACDFRDSQAKFKRMGFGIVGVSKDSTNLHKKFTEKENLNFPLISDESKEICEIFGVWQEKMFMGKKNMGIVRTTFVLDPSLKVLKVYEKVKAQGHVEKLIKDLSEMEKA